jgi:hypothetical protein
MAEIAGGDSVRLRTGYAACLDLTAPELIDSSGLQELIVARFEALRRLAARHRSKSSPSPPRPQERVRQTMKQASGQRLIALAVGSSLLVMPGL